MRIAFIACLRHFLTSLYVSGIVMDYTRGGKVMGQDFNVLGSVITQY